MGWDYETYQRQPAFFIRHIIEFQNIEQFARQVKEAEVQRQSKSSS